MVHVISLKPQLVNSIIVSMLACRCWHLAQSTAVPKYSLRTAGMAVVLFKWMLPAGCSVTVRKWLQKYNCVYTQS